MKNVVQSRVQTLKKHMAFWMSHLSVQTKRGTFFKPAILLSKTNTTSDSSIEEQMYCPFFILRK
jgi:hypothetical protein